jgi:hypothetical protein
MKNYVGISRDHSGSMAHLASTAAKDYNLNIETIKEGSDQHDIDTIVSVIKCGVGGAGKNEFESKNSSINRLKPITNYIADGGGTPLFDSIGELIEQLVKVPDANDPDVSFLVMVITDGQENASKTYTGQTIAQKIKILQATDKWTFTFRVPKGNKYNLVRLGIPEWNILEWDTTKKGLEEATKITRAAVTNYYQARATGSRSTDRFYSDLSSVSIRDVKAELDEITKEAAFFTVKRTSSIRDFIEHYVGTYQLGKSFYQLSKPEKVQGNKLIAIRDKKSGKVYAGDAARDLMGIPRGGEIKLHPGNQGNFDVFIQSTSVNRKLLPNTEVLYWRKA